MKPVILFFLIFFYSCDKRNNYFSYIKNHSIRYHIIGDVKDLQYYKYRKGRYYTPKAKEEEKKIMKELLK